MNEVDIREIISRSISEKEYIQTHLKQLTPPDELSAFIQKYEKIPWHRDRFLWHWVWYLCSSRDPGFMLSSVPPEDQYTVALIKSLLVMAVTIVDDVADKIHDQLLLEEMLRMPFAQVETLDDQTNSFEVDLLKELLTIAFELLKTGPLWQSDKEIFMYDLKQLWNSFSYSDLLNRYPEIINHTENECYSAHNMMFYIFGGIDLIFSTNVDRNKEYSRLREIFWHAQYMARIGNWMSTWKRELNEGDFSSGLISWGISNNVFTLAEIHMHNGSLSEKMTDIERIFIDKWEACRGSISRIGSHIRSIDTGRYISGLEHLLLYHLASKGLK